jgi:hypothetical protein
MVSIWTWRARRRPRRAICGLMPTSTIFSKLCGSPHRAARSILPNGCRKSVSARRGRDSATWKSRASSRSRLRVLRLREIRSTPAACSTIGPRLVVLVVSRQSRPAGRLVSLRRCNRLPVRPSRRGAVLKRQQTQYATCSGPRGGASGKLAETPRRRSFGNRSGPLGSAKHRQLPRSRIFALNPRRWCLISSGGSARYMPAARGRRRQRCSSSTTSRVGVICKRAIRFALSLTNCGRSTSGRAITLIRTWPIGTASSRIISGTCGKRAPPGNRPGGVRGRPDRRPR